MADYFFKDHELLVIQGEARLHGLERNNDAKTISPRLWEAKPACAGQNRVPCSRSVRDATSGARASGAPHRQRRSIPAGASNRSGRASACTLSRFRHQDAQNPPSPLMGEGGRGIRGKSAREFGAPARPGGRSNGLRCGVAPEYEDCARIARERGVLLTTVYQYGDGAPGGCVVCYRALRYCLNHLLN